VSEKPSPDDLRRWMNWAILGTLMIGALALVSMLWISAKSVYLLVWAATLGFVLVVVLVMKQRVVGRLSRRQGYAIRTAAWLVAVLAAFLFARLSGSH
jgi:hypothetical protein